MLLLFGSLATPFLLILVPPSFYSALLFLLFFWSCSAVSCIRLKKKRPSCLLTFSLNHFLPEHFPAAPSPHAYEKNTAPNTLLPGPPTSRQTERERGRGQSMRPSTGLGKKKTHHMKHRERFKKQKDTQPRASSSVTTLCITVTRPYELNRARTPSGHHFIFTTSYSSALTYHCPDNPEHEAQKAITRRRGTLYPRVAITRKPVQNVW